MGDVAPTTASHETDGSLIDPAVLAGPQNSDPIANTVVVDADALAVGVDSVDVRSSRACLATTSTAGDQLQSIQSITPQANRDATTVSQMSDTTVPTSSGQVSEDGQDHAGGESVQEDANSHTTIQEIDSSEIGSGTEATIQDDGPSTSTSGCAVNVLHPRGWDKSLRCSKDRKRRPCKEFLFEDKNGRFVFKLSCFPCWAGLKANKVGENHDIKLTVEAFWNQHPGIRTYIDDNPHEARKILNRRNAKDLVEGALKTSVRGNAWMSVAIGELVTDACTEVSGKTCPTMVIPVGPGSIATDIVAKIPAAIAQLGEEGQTNFEALRGRSENLSGLSFRELADKILGGFDDVSKSEDGSTAPTTAEENEMNSEDEDEVIVEVEKDDEEMVDSMQDDAEMVDSVQDDEEKAQKDAEQEKAEKKAMEKALNKVCGEVVVDRLVKYLVETYEGGYPVDDSPLREDCGSS